VFLGFLGLRRKKIVNFHFFNGGAEVLLEYVLVVRNPPVGEFAGNSRMGSKLFDDMLIKNIIHNLMTTFEGTIAGRDVVVSLPEWILH